MWSEQASIAQASQFLSVAANEGSADRAYHRAHRQHCHSLTPLTGKHSPDISAVVAYAHAGNIIHVGSLLI